MIAFYAVSNIILINQINIKEQYFPNEDADIYIVKAASVTDDMIQSVKKYNIFKNVCVTDVMYPNLQNVPRGLEKARQFLGKTFCYPYFIKKSIEKTSGEKKYDKFIVPNMELNSLYYAYYFYKNNRNMIIEMSDEGLSSYYFKKSQFSLPVILKEGNNGVVARFKYARDYFANKKLRGNINNTLYLNVIKNYNYQGETVDLKKINPGNLAKNVMEDFRLTADSSIINNYEKAQYYYLGMNKNTNLQYEDLETILEEIDGEKLLIRPHTRYSSEHRFGFAKKYENSALFDRSLNMFEIMLCGVSGMDNRTLIAVNSAAMMYPKCWFNKEPFLIITEYIHTSKTPEQSYYMSILKNLYSDPSKIYVPKNMDELRWALKEIKFRKSVV